MLGFTIVVWVMTVCGWVTHVEWKNNRCSYGLCQEDTRES